MIEILISWSIILITTMIELDKNIILLLIIGVIYYMLIKYTEWTLEYKILIIINIISIYTIILSKDIISMYIGLEGYSYTIYYLIVKELTKERKRVGLTYIIINSISSILILYNLYLIIYEYNTITITLLSNLERINGIWFILGILFKLGIYPFITIYYRINKEISKGMILYITSVSPIINIYLLYKFNEILNFPNYIIGGIGIITIILANIKGLKETKINEILIYSSIITSSYIIISLGLYLNREIEFNRTYLLSITLYLLQVILIFSLILLWNRRSNLLTFNINSFFPYLSLIIVILSYIGFPPLSGYYLKIYLVYPIIVNNYDLGIKLGIMTGFFIGNLLSILLYFKWIIPSSTLTNTLYSISLITNKEEKLIYWLIIIYITTWLIIIYPIILGMIYIWYC